MDFPGTPGEYNAITDVAGVRVGYSTLTDAARNLRSGVTAIIPRVDADIPRPVRAGQHTLNGNGEMTGTHWINDAGYFRGPVCITNTHAVGMVHHGAIQWMLKQYRDFYEKEHAWIMPVVAETYDGILNDINAQHIASEHALQALECAAPGAIEEGSVGGGNGMVCYEFKGGTGTASRLVELDGSLYSVGVLVQANHGIRPWLNVLGAPVGQHMREGRLLTRETGSIIVIVATDAPLSSLSLRHMARRAAIGIGRGGTPGGDSSGDIFLSFSVADEIEVADGKPSMLHRSYLRSEFLDPLYLAAVESVEEAVLNALVAGKDTPTFKPAGKICHGIDHAELVSVLRQYGRLKPADD
jgi:L-aminopeptidase/D-esterase-like protein